jgi:hypothetical protein
MNATSFGFAGEIEALRLPSAGFRVYEQDGARGAAPTPPRHRLDGRSRRNCASRCKNEHDESDREYCYLEISGNVHDRNSEHDQRCRGANDSNNPARAAACRSEPRGCDREHERCDRDEKRDEIVHEPRNEHRSGAGAGQQGNPGCSAPADHPTKATVEASRLHHPDRTRNAQGAPTTVGEPVVLRLDRLAFVPVRIAGGSSRRLLADDA